MIFFNDRSFEYCGEGSYTPYLTSLTERARTLRKNMTVAERKLWRVLRNRKFLGLKFVRQKPLLRYIADFYCAELRLVIEIDGSFHEKEYDDMRTDELRALDITVIRYTDDHIEYDLKNVLMHLSREISTIKSQRPPPRRAPLP